MTRESRRARGISRKASRASRSSTLPKNSQVAPGDFVITSGLGPYFPAGLRLGTVVEVPPVKNEYPTFGLYREAVIEPTADLNRLDELFIVLGPKEGEKTNDKGSKTESGAAPEASANPAPETSPPPDANSSQDNNLTPSAVSTDPNK